MCVSDLESQHQVSNITLSKGQSLLLRCRRNAFGPPAPVWEKGGKPLDARTLSCKAEMEEVQ